MSTTFMHAHSELTGAARAVEAMKGAHTEVEYVDAWKAFLSRLDKAWVKAEQEGKRFGTKFPPWQGRYQHTRRKDDLLKYLKHARDADHHSLQISIATERVTAYTIPGGGTITSMKFGPGGTVEHYSGPSLKVERRIDVVAIPIRNLGAWYYPPKAHLGRPVTSHNPVQLAELGLAYYVNFLKAADAKFR